jgi:CheY-like chemotaxis protein
VASPQLKKILVVDDDATMRRDLLELLEKLGGYTVEAFSTCGEALERASDFRPDLLLLDVRMPGMDGLSTLAMLREMPEMAHTPVVFMSRSVWTYEVPEYVQHGVVGMIGKPFETQTLCKQIEALWAQSHRHSAAGQTPA